MKLCYHDAWLYTKVKRLKYEAAFYSPKGKQEKNLTTVLLLLFCLTTHNANFNNSVVLPWCMVVHEGYVVKIFTGK